MSRPTLAADLADLRLGDLAAFVAVSRAGSVTRAARELDVSPSQVSKALARLEERLRRTLLRRSVRGVELTAAGEDALPLVRAMFETLGRLQRSERARREVLNVGAPSFLCALLFPTIAKVFADRRVRGFELAPASLRAHPSDGSIDILVATGSSRRMLPAWSTTSIGKVRKGVLCAPHVAQRLGRAPVAPEAIAALPFITPVYNLGGEFVSADDDCPLSRAERGVGHEVQTLQCALETVAVTDHAVFGPVCAARRFLRAGLVVEVRVRGWRVVDECFVAVHPDRLLARERDRLAQALSRRLAELEGPIADGA